MFNNIGFVTTALTNGTLYALEDAGTEVAHQVAGGVVMGVIGHLGIFCLNKIVGANLNQTVVVVGLGLVGLKYGGKLVKLHKIYEVGKTILG